MKNTRPTAAVMPISVMPIDGAPGVAITAGGRFRILLTVRDGQITAVDHRTRPA
jgi:hypothetical protein